MSGFGRVFYLAELFQFNIVLVRADPQGYF